MHTEDLKLENFDYKLSYLNGYLAAISFLNSYSIIGIDCKLHAFEKKGLSIADCLQNNAYALFGVEPNDWSVTLEELPNWEENLKTELNASLNRRKASLGIKKENNLPSENEHEAIKDLSKCIINVNNVFVNLLKHAFVADSQMVYELKVKPTSGNYRIVGIDLVFEIANKNVLVLQVLGND